MCKDIIRSYVIWKTEYACEVYTVHFSVKLDTVNTLQTSVK
jgi:hypothetical protein